MEIAHAKFYTVLGVNNDISLQDLRRQYFKLARKYHPDKNECKIEATDNFKLIKEAYEFIYAELTKASKEPQTGARNWRPDSSGKGATSETNASQQEGGATFEKKFGEDAARRSSSSGDQSPDFNWLGDQANTLAQLRLQRRRSAAATRGVNAVVLEKLRETLNNMRLSSKARVQVLPLIGKPGVLRCANCYRTFSQKVALQHIEFCGRKSSENGGITPNPLGRPVEVLSFGPSFKAKEYARKLSFSRSKKATASRRYSHPV